LYITLCKRTSRAENLETGEEECVEAKSVPLCFLGEKKEGEFNRENAT
jgi:hypothetical protein